MTSIAISGASGKLGRMIVQSLRTITKQPLVLLSRTPDSLIGASSDVEPRFADFDEAACLADAMAGVDRLYSSVPTYWVSMAGESVSIEQQ